MKLYAKPLLLALCFKAAAQSAPYETGLQALEAGFYPQAAALLQKAAAQASKTRQEEALYKQGVALFLNGQTSEARHAFAGLTVRSLKRRSQLWQAAMRQEASAAQTSLPGLNAKEEALAAARLQFLQKNYARAAQEFGRAAQSADGRYGPYALFYQAESYRLLKREPEALARYSALGKLFSQSPYAARALYASAMLQPKQQEALLQALVKSRPNSPASANARRQLANIYTQNNRIADLAKLISQTEEPQERQAFQYNLGCLLYAKRDFRRAESLFKAVLEGPNRQHGEGAAYALAQIYIAGGRQTEALTLLNQWQGFAGNLNWQRAALLLGLYRQAGQAQPAERLASQLINAGAKQPSAAGAQQAYFYLARGWAYENQGQTAEALADYATAASQAPQSPLAFESGYRIGLVYAKRGEAARAESYFNRLSQHPTLSAQEQNALLFARALSAYQAGQWAKAEALSLQLSKDKSSRPAQWKRILAASLSRQTNYARAAALYSQLVQEDQENAQDALYLAGINAYRAGNYRQAINSFNRLLLGYKEKDGGKAAYFWLGKSYAYNHLWQQAAAAFEKSQKARAGLKQDALRAAPSGLEALYERVIALHKSQAPNAGAVLRELERSDPKLAQEAVYRLGEDALAAGSYLQAGQLFSQAQKKEGANELERAALYRKALSLELEGRKEEAVRAYTDYLQRFSAAGQEALAASRKLAKLASHRQLGQLARQTAAERIASKVRAPLVLAWVQNAAFHEQNAALRLLDSLQFSELDDMEKSQTGLAKGRFYLSLKRYNKAAEAYEEALGLALAPVHYRQARQGKAAAYEALGRYAAAVREFVLIQQAFPDHEEYGPEALYQAYQLCLRHNLASQSQKIKGNLQKLYPKSPQTGKL